MGLLCNMMAESLQCFILFHADLLVVNLAEAAMVGEKVDVPSAPPLRVL